MEQTADFPEQKTAPDAGSGTCPREIFPQGSRASCPERRHRTVLTQDGAAGLASCSRPCGVLRTMMHA